MKRHCFLISGKIHTGKNQFADFLTQEFINKEKTVRSDLFAKILKDSCKADFKKLAAVLYNLSEKLKAIAGIMHQRSILDDSTLDQFNAIIDSELKIIDDNWYENKTDITRSLLQIYGTEIFRNRVDMNWWAKQTKERIKNSEEEIIILTDCRFPNEIMIFDDIISENFQVHPIRIERNINTNIDISMHDSETALDDWHEWEYIVDNNGSLDDLKASAVIIADNVLKDDYEVSNMLQLRKQEIFNHF